MVNPNTNEHAMQTGSDRRDFLRKATTGLAATGVAGAGLTGGEAAWSAPRRRQQQQTPPVGKELVLPVAVAGVPIMLGGQQFVRNFTGSITGSVEDPDPLTPNKWKVEILEFHLTSPAGTQRRQDLGRISIDGIQDTTPDGVLEMTQQFPPKFVHTLFLEFTMTIESPPQGRMRAAAEPLVLTTKSPGKLVGQLDSIPPQGAPYQLQNPIELVLPNQDETAASIGTFTATVGNPGG